MATTLWGPKSRAVIGAVMLVSLLWEAAFLGALLGSGTSPGFPLDDAWIHQTYARNLALHGEFAFVLGHPSAGSTSPLWTLLLVPGYWLHLAPFAWTWLLGWVSLVAVSLAAAALARQLFPEDAKLPLLSGVAVACEWHFVWGAVSGMETVLFAAGALALLTLAVRWGEHFPGNRGAFYGGLAVGAVALVRPEGILLGGVLGVALLLTGRAWPKLIARGGWLALGAGIVLVPELAFNFHVSGTPFPNTFYAKQQEYHILYQASLPARLISLLPPLLAGGLSVLLPAVLGTIRPLKSRAAAWLPLAWAVGTWGLYAWRLPVTYQHARYLMPIIPPLLVYGVSGLRRWWRMASGVGWMLTRAWGLSAGLVLAGFLVIGGRATVTDVQIINGEMVTVARWVNEHTPPDAVIAAHDIGALGYFASRPLLDLAGLISPQVIPFIRDEKQLLTWMEAEGAEYLVTFPSWYPQMTRDPHLEKVFQTDTAITRELGNDNMAVYRCLWVTIQPNLAESGCQNRTNQR